MPKDYYENAEKMREKGVVTDYGKNDDIFKDVTIESEKLDQGLEVDDENLLIKVGISQADLEIKYEQLIRDNLNGFAPARSVPTVKQAILYVFKKYLKLESANGGIMYIQNMLVTNSEIFATILSMATNQYKVVHEVEVNNKSDEEFKEDWEIEPTKNYNPETNRELPSKISLYQPLYMELKKGEMDKLEVAFIKYLEKQKDKIAWFWKNGSEHMKTNFGIQKADRSTFQPDFIIRFKDGRIGIFDTKAGKGFNEKDNEEKFNALYQYIYQERGKGRNLIGGLVIEDHEKFKYFESIPYVSYKTDKTNWKDFDELLK